MNKLIAITLFAGVAINSTFLYTNTASALDLPGDVSDNVAVAAITQSPIDNTAIIAMINPICQLATANKLILSKKAALACSGDAKAMPKLTKKGDRFKASGTGNEFATLIANIAAFND